MCEGCIGNEFGYSGAYCPLLGTFCRTLDALRRNSGIHCIETFLNLFKVPIHVMPY